MNTDHEQRDSSGEFLTGVEKEILLKIARDAISCAIRGVPLPPVNLEDYSASLREIGASFVTLNKNNQLRGCIGAIEAYQPFVMDVQEHAVAAALDDYRFPSVREDELSQIEIEISRLTPMQRLDYSSPADLISKLRVNIDGVLIRFNGRRATFLPQVWEKIPDPENFLSQLCVKMGAAPGLWRIQAVQVFTYQVESFKEA